MIEKIDPNKGIIISYPRSGLNWVRYCIEHFTGLRTPGITKLVDSGEFAVYRTHNVNKQNSYESCACSFYDDAGNPLHSKVVLLLRDYRESFIRVGRGRKKGIPTVEYIKQGEIFNFRNYFDNLRAYDQFDGEKLLIYYHNLIQDFSQVIKILDFFNLSYDLEGFDLEYHRQKSIQIYDEQHKSYTKKSLMDFSYHQNSVDSEFIEALDYFVDQNYPDLRTKYLSKVFI